MRMVDRTHEEVERIFVENALNYLQRGRPNKLRFEADQDLDLACIDIAQSMCFRIEVIEQLDQRLFGMFVLL